MRSESEMTLWSLRLIHQYKEEIQKQKKNYEELEAKARDRMKCRLLLEEEVNVLEDDVCRMREYRPYKYVAWKNRVKQVISEWKGKKLWNNNVHVHVNNK